MFPDLGVVSRLVALHLVPNSPDQDGWVVLVFTDRPHHGIGLTGNCLFVVIIKPVTFVAQPDTEGNTDSILVGIIQQRQGMVVDSPGAD